MQITIKADQPQAILIGHQGEYGVEEVFIDTSVWAAEYGTGVLSLAFTRPDGTQYPVALIDDTWHISEADNEYDGRGSAQLNYQIPNGRKKSCAFDVFVAKSDSTTPAPDPYKTWMDALQAMAALTQANAQAAEASAEAAETSETNAAASEAAAKASETAAAASEANAAGSAASAAESAGSASSSATAAASSETNAAGSASAAAASETNAATSATQAASSAESAGSSATAAAGSATSAGNSATAASGSASVAAGSAASASESATSAAGSASSASGSATAASASATASYSSALDSEAWAVGQKAGVDVPATDARYHNNSKFYAQQAAESATSAAGSATSASGSATSAGTSATSAAASAQAAQDVLDSIPEDYSELSADVSSIKDDLGKCPEIKNSTEQNADLDVSDESGNVLLRLSGGHVKTKNFDSSALAQTLSGKQDVLTFDSTPTENSTNPVTSGGVKRAIDAIGGGDSDIIIDSEETGVDLDVSDAFGNVIARFTDGGLVTKQVDGRKYTTFSKSGNYTVGQALTVTINKSFIKGDKIVLHVETGADPWTSGGRVAYYADDIQITDSTWRGAETYLEYNLPKDVSAISAVLPTNAFYESMALNFEVSLLGDIPITPTIVTIKKDGSGDYTNLKACLAGIGKQANDVLNPYRIEIYPGTYDVLADYTAEEKADIFYGDISINQYSQTSFVGAKLLNGMSLIGMGKPEDVVLTAWLDPTPTDDLSKRQRGQISTLNLQGSGSIENLTIIAQNMRYCVHDDFSAPLGKKCKRIVKNCIFRGYNIAYGPHTTYGAGMPQGGMDFLFIGCDFGEDVGVHTQPLLYQRPEIHLINCKGHSFRIGDNETVSPVEEYTIYRFDGCDFLDIMGSMADSVPHAKVRGTGSSHPFYQLDPQVEYNTGEITIVPLDVLGTALTVGTCVEMYNDNSSGVRFKAITALNNFAGIVVYVDDDDNTYIQTQGYIRTDRLGLSSFSLNDYIGLSGTACAVVASASDAFGKIVYIDNPGEGYVKIGGRF